MGAMVQASQLGVAKIVHFGTEEQKKQWLPGELIFDHCQVPTANRLGEKGGWNDSVRRTQP